ncbi:MAG: long-chain-acyl-CoA synthetase [Candidatus Hodarchaeota archaeon]
MTIFQTIPDKLPQQVLDDLKEKRYDEVILFTLAIFGPHRLEELVNNPSKSIANKMDEKLFHKWADHLSKDNYIEEYIRDNEPHYKITSKGEDRVIKSFENNKSVKKLVRTFNRALGIKKKGPETKTTSLSGYQISYKDYYFGLLSFSWRLESFSNAAMEIQNVGPEFNVSVGKCLEFNAETYPNNIAILYGDIKYTYKELNEWINRYANYFLSLGVKKGDVINIFLENRPELLFIIGAMSKIGTIGSLINTRQRATTLIHSLKLNPVNIYIIGEELIEPFEEVKPELGLSNKEKLFFLPDKDEMEVPNGYIDLKKAVRDQDIKNPPTTAEIKGKETYVYIFTSGTTGLPKAAHIRNSHTVSSMIAWGKMAMHMQPEDVLYISLPLFHSNAIQLGWASAIAGGSAVALARRFSVSNFWKDIVKYGATCFNYIGEICRYLFSRPPSPEDRNHKVYKICGNGLYPDIWKAFKERFGIREVYEHYGMTEMWAMFCNYLNLDCTVGFNFSPYTIVKYDIEIDEPIRGKDGFLQRVNEGEAGLVLMKMEHEYVFAGYTNREANKKKLIHDAFKKGDLWYNTGDMLRNIGYKHAQFVDRLGDTFRWKGENVSTSEVEDLITSFEKIDHASVYGVVIPGTDGRAGMASIISTVNHDKFDFENFLKTLQDNLPKYAIPIFIRFLSELSTTSTYKIQKFDMKKVGFNFKKIIDPIYVYLPGSSEYTLLTEEIYENILNRKYKF